MKVRRRRFSKSEKLRLLRHHFSDGASIEELSRRHQLHPTLLYRWRREFLARLDSRDESSSTRARALVLRRRIRAIDSRIARLHSEVDSLRGLLEQMVGSVPASEATPSTTRPI